MEDVTALEQFKGQEELLAVGAHSLDMQPHVFAILLQHLTEVHAAAKK